MGISRLGILADFFSRPVMGGFVSAGGVLIMLSQCANWLGVKVPNRDLPFLTVLDLMEQSPHINTTSFLLGGVSILILLGMRALKRRVVREMAELEEELEEEFAIETTRAVSRMQSIGDESDAEDDNDHSHQESGDNGKARKRSPSYDDIELGELPASSHGSDQGNSNSVLSKLRAKVRAQEQRLQQELEADDSDLSPRRRKRPTSLAESDTPKPSAQRPSDWLSSLFSTRASTTTVDATGMMTTGSLRRSDFLSSPWTSSGRRSNRRLDHGDLGDLDVRSCRHGDLSHITRSTRHRTNVIKEDGVGFSLSDEDFLTLEQPLEQSAVRRSMASAALDDGLRRSPRGLIPPPTLRRSTSASAAENVSSQATLTSNHSSNESRRYPDHPPRPSPAKSLSDDTASITDSTCSTTALNGKSLEAIVSSSTSIRILRSKIAALIALRLVCDLGSFMVCLLGGIVGYVAAKDTLKLTGEVPGGYPSPKIPWYGLLTKVIEADRLYHIVIDTLSIAIISYMSSIAMAKRLAIKEGYRIRPNQELIALGLSNLVGSFFQSMPATGGLSRTAVNMQNARTQLASLITVGVVVVALYTATSALAYLPKASLAAIIIVAGQSLIETSEARWLYRVKRDEFYVWLASFVLTVLLGVLPGLLSSIFCSLVAVIYKTRRPTLTMMGEIVVDGEGDGDQTTRIVELDLYPDTARPLSDIVVIRVEGALYFANCEYVERVVEREISKREHTEGVAVHGVIVDACSIMDWDSTTIQMMKHLQEDLHVRGIQLAIVNARDRLQTLLESTEFLYGIVLNDARIGFNEAITAIREGAIHVEVESRSDENGQRSSTAEQLPTLSTHGVSQA
ncbi:hypothetical protein PINS_up022239 [Pythium insidiosum]|nr:hypothetical protein PINS_up022239 [Pythium insidiosum]